MKEQQQELEVLMSNIQLKGTGFVKEPGIGFVFPGVNITKFDLSKWQQEKISRKPPRMQLKPISTNGTLVIEFDQEMMVPKILDPKVYESIFKMKLIRHETKYQGVFVKNSSEGQSTDRRLQQERLNPEEQEQAEI